VLQETEAAVMFAVQQRSVPPVSFYLARVIVRLDVFAFVELIIVSIVGGVLCNAYFAVFQHAILTLRCPDAALRLFWLALLCC
jgi:hypothetical protein